MSSYSSFWVSKQTVASRLKIKKRHIVVLRVTPYGWDDKAYFVRSEALEKQKQFKEVEQHVVPGQQGALEVFEKYAHMVAQLEQTHIQVVPEQKASIVLFPQDVWPHRAKEQHECLQDLAMLAVEVEQYAQAQSLIDQLPDEVLQDAFTQTILRRMCANQAQDETDAVKRGTLFHAAYEHACCVIDTLDADHFYGFGDYQQHETVLALAHQTVAEYWLEQKQYKQALAACQAAYDTYYADSSMYAIKAQALYADGQEQEAFKVVYEHNLHWCEELSTLPAYKTYEVQQQAVAERKKAQHIAQIRIEQSQAQPVSDSNIVQWHQVAKGMGFELPSGFAQWLVSANPKTLKVTQPDDDGTYTTEYALVSPAVTRDKVQEIQGWLRLHEDSPDLMQDILEAIQASGVDPKAMLPIVGPSHTPDCFLLRLDVDENGKAGAVYFWSHEEQCTFDRIADDVPGLFTWLEQTAREGNVFSL